MALKNSHIINAGKSKGKINFSRSGESQGIFYLIRENGNLEKVREI